MPIRELPNIDPGTPLTSTSALTMTTELTPIQSDETSAAFTIPSTFTGGVYAYSIKNIYTNRESPITFLNKPDLWFYMGDNGKEVTPGGWIELYGRSLSLS